MDKMTNACFQDHASTKLSRRKEERKSPRTKTNPILYSSAFNISSPFNVPVISLRGNDAYQKSVDSKKTVKVSKKKSGYRAEDDQLTSPSTIKFCDYVCPISVDPDRRNCLLGNTINLLDYLDHLDDSLSRGINEVILASGSMTDIKQILCRHGYCILNLPSFLMYPELTAFVHGLRLPMLINVQLPGVQAEHVVGIAP